MYKSKSFYLIAFSLIINSIFSGHSVEYLPDNDIVGNSHVTVIEAQGPDSFLAGYASGSLKLWDLATRKGKHVILSEKCGNDSGVSSLAARDGQVIIGRDRFNIDVFRPESGESSPICTGECDGFAYSGKRITAVDLMGECVVSGDTWGLLKLWYVNRPTSYEKSFRTLVISSRQKEYDPSIVQINVDRENVSAVNSDGKIIQSDIRASKGSVWDTKLKSVNQAVFLSSSYVLLSKSETSNLSLWNLAERKCVKSMSFGGDKKINTMTLMEAGLVMEVRADNETKLLRLAIKEGALGELKGDPYPFHGSSEAFVGVGKHLVTTGRGHEGIAGWSSKKTPKPAGINVYTFEN
ncbi:MAG TPA: hypothetical protein QGF02_02915 [Candidatus Babeliales bacterium]|nr:hypothetical protein [Candidatus Babeliales bacterium]